MPGMAASSKIFEYISMDKDRFMCHFLEWILPLSKDESLSSYSARMAKNINHQDIILVGVSFGGIIVQELSKLIKTRKVIIISSIKTEKELPKRLRFLKTTRAYKWLPSRQIANRKDFAVFGINKHLKRKIKLYNKYLSVRDQIYLNWAVYNMLNWKNETDLKVTHIHGTKDGVFPIRNIENCIPIENGGHAMIVVQGRKIGRILETVIDQ